MIKNCIAHPETFEKPIKKTKHVASFAEEGVKINRRVNGKFNHRTQSPTFIVMMLDPKTPSEIIVGSER